jgi:hypothetical protein
MLDVGLMAVFVIGLTVLTEQWDEQSGNAFE